MTENAALAAYPDFSSQLSWSLCALMCMHLVLCILDPANMFKSMVLLVQGRPGPWIALLLGLLGVCALGGGFVTILGVVGLWLITSSASPGTQSSRAKDEGRDNLSEGTAASDADSGLSLQPIVCPLHPQRACGAPGTIPDTVMQAAQTKCF